MIPTVETLAMLHALQNHKEGETVFVKENQETYVFIDGEWQIYCENKDISLGTLYDVNKQIIQQLPPYNRENFADSILLINSYAEKSANKYYMLLCNDIKYFTLFVREQCMETETIGEAAIDCSQYLGEVKSINYNDNESAIEIWFVSTIDQEAHVAYFFAYDEGVISCV